MFFPFWEYLQDKSHISLQAHRYKGFTFSPNAESCQLAAARTTKEEQSVIQTTGIKEKCLKSSFPELQVTTHARVCRALLGAPCFSSLKHKHQSPLQTPLSVYFAPQNAVPCLGYSAKSQCQVRVSTNLQVVAVEWHQTWNRSSLMLSA